MFFVLALILHYKLGMMIGMYTVNQYHHQMRQIFVYFSGRKARDKNRTCKHDF